MGVPSFFNWIIKNKKIDNLIIDEIAKNIDYLFIDTNCLMHPCVNKIIDKYKNNSLTINGDEPLRTQLEKYIMEDIQNCIMHMISITHPKYVYIAIDGVAPMGKIIQQRQRRYKYLYDNKTNINLLNINLDIPISSIELTPGTDYMERLHLEFEIFANKNNFIYSSYHEEGEGEHKILQYVRNHLIHSDNLIIYGLDADLLFLALSIKNVESVFVMRECAEFKNILNNNNNNNKNAIDKTVSKIVNKTIDDDVAVADDVVNFNYVDISIFKIMINNLGITINDFILICFLIGNDFIPKILTIDVKRGGLDKIIASYNSIVTKHNLKKNNNENNNSNNNNNNVDVIINSHGKINYNILNLLFDELKFTEKNIWKNINRYDTDDLNRIKFSSSLEYYNYYLGTNWTKINEQVIKNMVENYLTTFHWCIDYYLDKCNSWKHCYNFHVPPLLTDISKYILHVNTNYTHTKSVLKPIEQLILVIPPKLHKFIFKNDLIDKIKNLKSIEYMFPDDYDLDVNKEHIEWKYFIKIPVPDFDDYYDVIKNI